MESRVDLSLQLKPSIIKSPEAGKMWGELFRKRWVKCVPISGLRQRFRVVLLGITFFMIKKNAWMIWKTYISNRRDTDIKAMSNYQVQSVASVVFWFCLQQWGSLERREDVEGRAGSSGGEEGSQRTSAVEEEGMVGGRSPSGENSSRFILSATELLTWMTPSLPLRLVLKLSFLIKLIVRDGSGDPETFHS